jgi:hypothetical protein
LPPEILCNNGHGKPADVWTVGCFVFEQLAGHPPWSMEEDEEVMALYTRILSGKLAYPKCVAGPAKALVKGCLTHGGGSGWERPKRAGCDPKKGGIAALGKAPFFASVDLERLRERQLPAAWLPPVFDASTLDGRYPDSEEPPKEPATVDCDLFEDF